MARCPSSCPASPGASSGSSFSTPASRCCATWDRTQRAARSSWSAAPWCCCAVPVEPRATYRVQLRAGFGFADAAAVLDYLAELGISHLYCSPYLQAAPGRTHGYDVLDYAAANAWLGGSKGHVRLLAALEHLGLGRLRDIVPNPMAIPGRGNRWWWDVLKNGPASRYAPYFDVEWQPPEAKLRNTVLLPVLSDHYGRVLER